MVFACFVVFSVTLCPQYAILCMNTRNKLQRVTLYLAGCLLLIGCRTKTVAIPPVAPQPSPVAPVVMQTPTVEEPPVVTTQPVQPAVIPTWEESIQASLDSLCEGPLSQTSQIGLYVFDMSSGKPLYSRNENQRMRPASCQKVITAVCALDLLGGDYQFRTELRTVGNLSAGVLTGDVYVVGGMDPLFSRNDMSALATALRKSGITRINGHIYMDVSMKDDMEYGWGWCWDDDYGPLSALTVDGKADFPTLWIRALRQAGIVLSSASCTTHVCPPGSHPLKSITHSIDEVLVPMMKDSENIFAESMFQQIAARSGNKGAGHNEAATLMADVIQRAGLHPDAYTIADGSGLSLYNYASPVLLSTMLLYACQHETIHPHFCPSLPVAGVDGTLRKRMLGTAAAGNVHAKTGTVMGVSTLTGYLQARNGHQLVFSIMNQGIEQASQARDFQDRVCNLLCR